MKIWSRWGHTTMLMTLVFAADLASSGTRPGGPVLSLEELAGTADLVCKATVIDDRPVTDNSFPELGDSEVHETKLRVVSTVKGSAPNVIWFRHYTPSSELPPPSMKNDPIFAQKTFFGMSVENVPGTAGGQVSVLTPAAPAEQAGLRVGDIIVAFDGQSTGSAEAVARAVRNLQPRQRVELRVLRDGKQLSLHAGMGTPADARAAIWRLFTWDPFHKDPFATPWHGEFVAFATGRTYLVFATRVAGGTYRELARSRIGNQSVLLAADPEPHHGTTATEAVWAELLALLKSPDDADVIEAIYQLDTMSGGWDGQSGLKNFERPQALAAIQPLIRARSVKVATAAITVFGMDSPYFNDQDAPFWFVGIGNGHILGLSARKRLASPLADVGSNELLQVATDGVTPDLRALAIRAHGRSREIPAAMVSAWLRDPSIAVRRAAVLASADLPDREPIITTASTDASPDVRRTAALAVGFSQDPRLLPLLNKLLRDSVTDVRNDAALSLLSFAPDQAAPVLKENLTSDFRPLFVTALASVDPQPYLSMLAEVIEQQGPESSDWPPNWNYGGFIPAADSWRILFDFVKSRPAVELTAGEFDRSLDALERVHFYNSGQPTSLYALYLSRGMVSRAKRFRDTTRERDPHMDYYFDMVDGNPAGYFR